MCPSDWYGGLVVVVSSLPNLEEAYEACRQETAEWAKTFYLGTLLMPPAKRRAIWAIYVWCRRTDELMDSIEAQQRPTEELAARLDAWEQRTRALFAGKVIQVDTTPSQALADGGDHIEVDKLGGHTLNFT